MYKNPIIGDIGDHYVALLSPGLNLQETRRPSKFFSRFARLSATAILLVVAGSIILPLLKTTRDFTHIKALATSFHFPSYAQLSREVHLIAPHLIEEFEDFVMRHGKVYKTIEEKAHRLQIFAQNSLFIQLHNAQNYTYALAANTFTDLNFDEFKNLHYTGYRERRRGLQGLLDDKTDWSLLDVDEKRLPDSLDWKAMGCVTPPKDQKKCGSCWAFSSSGAVEGAYCAATGKLISLSEQQMIDCSGPEGNEGCNGGEMDDAFQYIIDHGGLCTEEDYPYTAKDDQCHDSQCQTAVDITKFADVPKKSPKALKAALALKGPVAVAIQADQLPFQFYHHGVFDASCGKDLNHGVLAVGYGTDEESGKDYWLVKNSWGVQWGDMGFIKLIREASHNAGECGILLEPSYPVLKAPLAVKSKDF